MATQGGPAMNVVVDTSPGAQVEGGSAVPVAVVTGRAVTGNKATRVVVVTNPDHIEGGPAIPVVAAAAGDTAVEGGPAMRVYVVSGVLGAAAPVNTGLPTISGSGATLSASTGSWSNSPTSYSYQWYRGGVAIGGAITNSYTIGASDIGATLTVTVTATNATGSGSATSASYTLTYTQKVIALSPIAYWPMAEPSGTTITDESGNGRNGTYTNVTLGATGIGDGRTAATFNGSTSKANVYSASFAGAWNGDEFTLSMWVIVRAASVWSDAAFRNMMRFNVDANNTFFIQKRSAANTLQFNRVGAANNVNIQQGGFGSTAWMHVAVTCSKAATELKAYVNAVQIGATGSPTGAWTGALSATETVIGCFNTTPAQVWDGSIAHVAIFNSALNSTQIASLATVP